MAIDLAQGSQIAFASTYAASKAMSAVTNADPGVATLEASHGIVAGDIMSIVSGWENLNGMVIRAGTPSTNDIPLEGFDTTSTSRFPAGEGAGSIREISAFTTITQIKQLTSDNPGVELVDITNLANRVRKQVPGLQNTPTYNFTLQYDSALSWWDALLAVSDALAETAMRIITPAGRKIYMNGYWAMQVAPQLNTGQEITHALVFVQSSPRPSPYTS